MSIALDPKAEYRIVAANAHYYKTPAPERSIDRVLPYHDFIYLLEGQWAITEGEMEYQLEKGDVLLLRAGMHHYTSKPCLAGTRTYCIHVEQMSAQGDAPDEDALLPTRLHTDDANIRRYFESIVNVYWSEGAKYKEEKLSAFTRILVLELLSMYRLQCEDTRGIAGSRDRYDYFCAASLLFQQRSSGSTVYQQQNVKQRDEPENRHALPCLSD